MRVLVVSDSHGNVDNMVRAVEWVQPDYVLHLGDCQRDLEALRREFPGLAMEGVPGNCDTRNVKSSPMAAMYAAKECGAQVLLFGHTHRPMVDNDGTLLTLNPGAAGDWEHPTCGVLTIENGKADVKTVSLREKKE